MIVYSLRKRPIQTENASQKQKEKKKREREPGRQWARRERDSRRLQRPPRPAQLGSARPPSRAGAAVQRREAGDRLLAERQRPGGPAAPGLRALRVPGRPSPLRCELCGAAAAPGERTPALGVTPLRCPRSRGGGGGNSRATRRGSPASLQRGGAERPVGPACAARAPHLGGHGGRFPGPSGPAGLPRCGASALSGRAGGRTAPAAVRRLRPGAAAPPQPCSRRSGPRGSATPAAARACSS